MTTTHTAQQSYDAFTGPDLDFSRWFHLEYPMPEGPSWVCAEPHARTTVADGVLTIEVDRFEIQHPVQVIDNCKHVLLSTDTFEVPESGTVTVSGDIAARDVDASPHDYRDGFVSLIVIELSTGLVFDVATTSDHVFAIHERLPVDQAAPCFTRIVDDPLARVATGAGVVHRCSITLDRAGRSASWTVDDTLLFAASGIDIPAVFNIGMGMFSLHPVGADRSRSLHGQGLHGSWSNLHVDVSA